MESKDTQDKPLSRQISVIDKQNKSLESKPLHGKVILTEGILAVYSEEMERISVASGKLDWEDSPT